MDEQQKPVTDEIDLSVLFRKVGSAIQSFGTGVMRVAAKFRRVPYQNRASFLGIIGVSVALAVAYSFLLKEKYYESTLIINCAHLNKRLADNALDKLDALAEETNAAGLAKVLNISDSLANSILGFKVRTFVTEEEIIDLELLKKQLELVGKQGDEAAIEYVLTRIDIDDRHSFEITVRTSVPEIIPDLQDPVVNYLRNNSYVKRRLDINRSILQNKMDKINSDLTKLDSLKRAIFENYKKMAVQGREGSNNVILSDRAVTDPIVIFNADLALYNEMKGIEQNLYLEPEFEVIDGFTEFSEPASPGLVKLIVIAFVLGFIVAWLDLGVRELNKFLAKFD